MVALNDSFLIFASSQICLYTNIDIPKRLINIGGSRGAPNMHPRPTGPNSFILAYIFVKNSPCRTLIPPTGLAPPTENPGSVPDKT